MAFRMFRRKRIHSNGNQRRPTKIEAERSVIEIYKLILRRDPDQEGLSVFVGHMVDGGLTELEVVRAIIESEEFGVNAVRLPNVAEAVAKTLMRELLTVYPSESDEKEYIRSLCNGLPLVEFMHALAELPEAGSREKLPGFGGGVLPELSELTESLIVAHLAEQGAVVSFAPTDANLRPRVSEQQMASLIRTLDMLARQTRMLTE